MTRQKDTTSLVGLKAALREDRDFLREIEQSSLQDILEAEMDETLGAAKGERTPTRLGYRSGYYARNLVTRVGKVELRVPRDREGRFNTEVFERYSRAEKALFASLVEMYGQGVSTRKVKAITEELCDYSFSASTVSRLCQQMDEELERFARRPLEEIYPYLILDARYEKVRENGVIHAQAVQVALGMNEEGRRCVLAVDLARRESEWSWRDLLVSLKKRGLRGVEFVVSDDHQGLKKAIGEILPEAVWQRCYVTFRETRLITFLARRTTIV